MRVFIAMSYTGGGHRAMSAAIDEALRQQFGTDVDVEIDDVFDVGSQSAFERVTLLYGPVIRIAPWFYGWLYHSINHPRRYGTFSRFSWQATRNKFSRMLERNPPDVVVNTHPLANRPILDAVQESGRKVPVVASVSELVSVHVSWVDPRLDVLNTGTPESFSRVVSWGADARRVRCLGLPVDARFASVEPSPAELREAMGLDPQRFTALLIGGGEGAGGLEAIVREIQGTDLDVQLVVVCGHNKRLRQRLERASLRTPTFVLGFVKTIPELMHAADVVVTKGGPQTIAEALVASRPVVLTQTLPGQEEGNGAFVEGRGVGFGPGPVPRIVANLGRLVNNPDERCWMTANARRHGKPLAARQMAELIYQIGNKSSR